MRDIIKNYIQAISEKFTHEETSEMGYRTDFENLIKSIFESINVRRIDHDPKAKQHNKPDFIVLKNDVPILYIEAKDIGVSLDKIEKSEQMARYYGYTNLVLTDYVEFRFYRNGLRYEEPIIIANYGLKTRILNPLPENYEHLIKTLLDFPQSQREPIRSGKHLAKIMGGKAQRIRDNIRQFYSFESEKNSDLLKLYKTLKELLVHDLTINSFADMYAQTLVYGLFVARYYDKTQARFSRQEARELIPNSNPLLRHFFDHIVGTDFDTRLKYIVDELCDVFSHANVEELMKEYFKVDLWGKTHRGPDPVIHFYEDFLNEYDPILRKKMGAYYTPLPVVDFIVHSVDCLLKKEFGLIAGLADTSKTTNGLHKVQILDPACGTGTFISSVIRNIYMRLQDSGQKGRWPAYVHHDLLPRLYGFEIMMAPYTIAHLKLGIAFRQTGFWDFHRRLGIYLTNSLEKTNIQQQELFTFGLAESIVEESRDATEIKNEKPIMIVVGNPPYRGESSNNFESANNLVNKYKFEPGGIQKLRERNPKWINDDYVKFIALAEDLVEKNGEGIIGYITNHAYLDNPTFRGMRWKLADTFDAIYIVDLHGNAKKKEVCPDGSKDENVFDIMQGVSILLAVKKKTDKKTVANIYHADIYGKREEKFKKLTGEIKYKKIDLDQRYYFFVPKSTEGKKAYESGFSLNDLFVKTTVGIVTGRDSIAIAESKESLKNKVTAYINKPSFEFAEDKVKKITYRPFDIRWIYYSREVVGRGRWDLMQNFLSNENVGLIFKRGGIEEKSAPVFVSRHISESRSWSRPGMQGIEFLAPLYLYPKDRGKVPNLKKGIVDEIEKGVGKVSPEDIFDYIYAVLHSPSYREKYKEFLKIDFPRIPYPKDKVKFKKLVSLGKELREIHLLNSPLIDQFITTYPIEGSNIVEKIVYRNNNVYINKNQYFGNIPDIAWDFYIGGYQPAQKWLKDRKGQELTNEDIEHYQKIIVALTETERIMKGIDKLSNDL